MSHHTATDGTRAPERDLAPTERLLFAQLERIDEQIAELELVLSDPDAIQEDRDSARTILESMRGDAGQIRSALARIESGSYGQCASCGCSIADERLRLLPFAANCTSCA